MKIPKRKQILTYTKTWNNLGRRSKPFQVEYLVRVTEVSHTKKSCKVICLAILHTDKDINQTYYLKPRTVLNQTYYLKPRTVRARVVDVMDLPLYISWECGSAFEKLLKEIKV